MKDLAIPIVTKYIEQGEDEIEVEIAFDFQPEEQRTWDYPGCDASLDIYEVTVVETGSEICLLPKVQELMEEEILDDYYGQDPYGWVQDAIMDHFNGRRLNVFG